MSLHMNVEVPVIFKAAYEKDPVYNMNVSIYNICTKVLLYYV